MAAAGNSAGNGDHTMRYTETAMGSVLTLAALALVVSMGITFI